VTVVDLVAVHVPIMSHRNTETRQYRNAGYDLGVAPSAAYHDIRSKRLTLDLAPELHRALKVRAVDLDVPMAELLRALIEQALGEPSTFSSLAENLRRR
jgi:hypothetical protein